jgi:hypothetical protein
MSGDTEMDDPEISDGASENEYSDHELEIERDDDDNTDMAEHKSRTDTDGNGKAVGSATAAKPKLDPKDPLRPRRKKARRACFACQRAHLTCGMFSRPSLLSAVSGGFLFLALSGLNSHAWNSTVANPLL